MTDGSSEPGPFEVTACRCRSGHEWVPADLRQSDPPRVRPKCELPSWTKPYQFRRPALQGGRPAIVALTSDHQTSRKPGHR